MPGFLLLDTPLCILILTYKKVSNRYYVTEEEPNRVPRVTAELGHLASETWRAEGKAGALKALRGPSSFTLFQKGEHSTKLS